MKKVFVLSLLALSIALSAGLVFAQVNDDRQMPREEMRRPDFNNQPRRMPPEKNFECRGRDFKAHDFGKTCERFSRPDFNDKPCGNLPGNNFMSHGHAHGLFLIPGMTPEIKAKAVELAKLKIDLEAAFTDKPLDKNKLMNIYKAMSAIEQEINIWKFERHLDKIEEHKRQLELNHTVPTGAPKTEENKEPAK